MKTPLHPQLYFGLIEDPSPERKLVYADWLEEQGADELAYAYRWAAGEGVHPYVTQHRRAAVWRKISRKHRAGRPGVIGALVFYHLPATDMVGPRSNHVFRYRTLDVAFIKLAQALLAIRRVVEVKPIKRK